LGSLYYLSLDVHCTSIVYSSNHSYKYIFDSINEIVEKKPEEEVPMESDECTTLNEFQWSQKGEDITINFKLIPEALKDEYHIKCEKRKVEIKCKDQVLLDSELFGDIDVDLTTWTLENEFLQLNLIKQSEHLFWPCLLSSGGPPETPHAGKHIESLSSQPVSDLNSQMEDCDFGEDGPEDNEYFIGK
jgi:hypothetical protein